MSTTNDITGDRITSKANSASYRNNFDAIDWSKPDELEDQELADAIASARDALDFDQD